MYEPYGLILKLDHLQQLPELLRETEDLMLLQRQDPMEAEGCPLNFSVRCKRLSGPSLSLQMLCPPRRA